jgi:hypothetical protein
MRHHAFDQLVTSVAKGGSRRWTLKAALGIALGSALTLHDTRTNLALPAEELECRQDCTLKCRRQVNPKPRCVTLCLVKVCPGLTVGATNSPRSTPCGGGVATCGAGELSRWFLIRLRHSGDGRGDIGVEIRLAHAPLPTDLHPGHLTLLQQPRHRAPMHPQIGRRLAQRQEGRPVLVHADHVLPPSSITHGPPGRSVVSEFPPGRRRSGRPVGIQSDHPPLSHLK